MKLVRSEITQLKKVKNTTILVNYFVRKIECDCHGYDVFAS